MAKQKDKQSNKASSLLGLVQQAPGVYIPKLISISANARLVREPHWKRYRRKYRRGLYYLSNNSNTAPLFFTNYIFSTIEAFKSNLARNIPALSVRAKGNKDDIAADIMTKVLDNSLRNAKIKRAAKGVLHNGALASYGIFKVIFDPTAEGGKGENKIISILPENMLFDPMAVTPDDLRWAVHEIPDVSVDKIYADYGVIPKAAKVESDDIREDDVVKGTEKGYGLGDNEASKDVLPTYTVYECWLRDWNPDAENKWYVIVFAGNTVLQEGYSVYAHNELPFVIWFDGEDEGAENLYLRGVGEVEEIEPLQDRADSLDAKILKAISLMANRQRFISLQSGLNSNSVDNTQGRTYTVNGDPTKAVYYDAPPSPSGDVYGYRSQTDQLIQTVSGIFDVTQGKRPTGITAGRAIQSLKDSADTRILDKTDSFAEAFEKVGGLSLSNILQFYDGERIIRLTDANDELVVLSEYPEALKAPAAPVLDEETGEPMLDEETGEPMLEDGEVDEQLQQLRQQFREENGIALVLEDITFDYDIIADTNSALPQSPSERAQLAADLFRLGAVDREAVLDALDYPDKQKILQRLASEATGKNAGQPMAEAGLAGQQSIDQLAQMLQQMGMPPEMIDQIIQQMSQGGAQQPPQGGNFPPQVAM